MKYLFWAGMVTVLYTYIGYPACLWLRSRLLPKPVRRAPWFPSVSVVMVVRDEERILPRKLANLTTLTYPSDRIEFIVVSDGSRDSTEQLLERHTLEEPRLRVIACAESRGKAAGLNDGISRAQGDVVLFTDARQAIEADALRLLMENFADPAVGCASGELMLGDPATGECRRGTGLYWSIEKKIRELESASGSVVGATGALYAVRRPLLAEVPAGTILDDVYLPMQVVRQGSRVVFDDRARAWDVCDLGEKREFSRKVRTLSGNYQLLQLSPWLLGRVNPIRFEFVSHKLMRLLVPLALVVILLSSLWLGGLFFRAVLLLQIGFYGLSLLGVLGLVKSGVLARAADAARTFVMLNTAAGLALVNWISRRKTRWKRVERETPATWKASETP